MTGISAREATRTSRRLRPQASGKAAAIAPPVLFRLPSIALPAPSGDTPLMAANSLAHGDTAPTPSEIARGDTAHNAGPIASNGAASPIMPGTYPNASGAAAGGLVAGTNLAGTNLTPGNSVAGTNSVAVAEKMAGTESVAAKSELSASKNRGQQLLNTLIALLLLVALVVITWVSVKQPHRDSEIVKSENASSALESLSQLEVPQVTVPKDAATQDASDLDKAGLDKSASLTTKNSVANSSVTNNLTTNNSSGSSNGSSMEAASQNTTASKTAGTDKAGDDSTIGSLSGLDLAGPNPSATNGAAGLASKSTTGPNSLPTASVSLGAPTPMSPAASLTAQPSGSTLPLTTPRYETVSAPTSSTKTVFEATSSSAGTPSNASTSKNNSPTSNGTNVNSNTTTGGSPSLWDGARTSSVPDTQSGGLTISKPMSAEISMTPTTTSGSKSTTSDLASPSSNSSAGSTSTDYQSELSNSFLLGQNNKSSSTTSSATASTNVPTASVPTSSVTSATVPGVTVGGGLKEPGNLSETQTPNLDVAKLSQQYVEYSRQKSLTGGASQSPVNSYQLPPQDARQAVPTGVNSYTQSYAATAPVAPQMPSSTGGPINSYAQAGIPYGVTGGSTTPYVRNSPGNPTGTNATGTTATLASGPTQPPTGLPVYQAPTMQQGGLQQSGPQQSGLQQSGLPQGGYAVPPRAGSVAAPAPAPYSANSAATSAGVMSGTNGYGPAAGSGFPNTSYPTPNYSQPTYAAPMYGQPNPQQPAAQRQSTQPGTMQPSTMQPGTMQPGTMQPSTMQPGTMQPGTMQPTYQQPSVPQAGYVQPNYAQPGMMQTSGGTMSASVPPRNTMPVNNLYPGGQAPAGLIGQTGFATAPTGDFTPTPPVPVTGTVGYGTSSPSNMGTLPLGR